MVKTDNIVKNVTCFNESGARLRENIHIRGVAWLSAVGSGIRQRFIHEDP